MKFFTCLGLFFLLIAFSYATPILTLQHTSVQPGEPFIGTISTDGTFITGLESFDILEGRKSVNFESEMFFHDNTYYFYVIFPREGRFTVDFGEVVFSLFEEVGSVDLTADLEVAYTNYDNVSNTAIDVLSISPPIVFTLANSSELILYNRGSNSLSVNVDGTDISLAPFGARKINLNLVEALSFVTVSAYKDFSIPIIYLGAAGGALPVLNETEIFATDLVINTPSSELLLLSNSTNLVSIEIANTGETDISEVAVIYSPDLVNATIVSTISAETYVSLDLSIYSLYPSFINKSIIISYVEDGVFANISVPVLAYLSEEQEEVVVNENSCSAAGGNLCDGSCDGESTFASDGYCCLGQCIAFNAGPSGETESGSGYGIWIGILIFVILAIVGWFFYKKYKTIKPASANARLGASAAAYQNKLQGGAVPPPVRVDGNLERH
jgi:hypothetical protein